MHPFSSFFAPPPSPLPSPAYPSPPFFCPSIFSSCRSPFPPLSVVGLLPPRFCPEHSCVPNVQLEASLASATTDPEGSSGSALRVGFVTLRGIRAGDKLFAPYVALGQPVDERRQELLSSMMLFGAARSSSLLVCRCPRCLLEAEGDRSCGPEMLKVGACVIVFVFCFVV